MQAPYRDGSETLRMKADALELQNAILQRRVRSLEAKLKRRSRKGFIEWLTGAMAVVIVLALAAALIGSCMSVAGAALMGVGGHVFQ